jgi:acyl carrier protein
MLTQSRTKDKIVAFINEYFIKDTGVVLKDDTSLLDEGILDSTGVMELVSYIESDFRITVEDEEIVPDNFDSIRKLSSFIDRKLKKMPRKEIKKVKIC